MNQSTLPVHLFVYGSLLSTVPSSMSQFLRRKADLVGKATTAGRLYDLGMYPGLVAEGTETVRGELYRLHEDTADLTLELLDAYEGVSGEAEDEYRRIVVTVKVEDGGSFQAETYVSTGDLTDRPLIPRGDYRAFYPTAAEHQRFVNGG